MIPFLVLLSRRWSRRVGGIAALVFPVACTILIILVADREESLGERDFGSAEATFALLVGGPAMANLIAAAVHDERRTGCARLLRVGSVDGRIAAGGYLLFGVLFALLESLLFHVALGMRHPEPLPWISGVAGTGALMAAFAPVAILLGYLLLPPASHIAVTVATLGGSMALLELLSSTGTESEIIPAAPMVGVALAANLGGWPLLAWLWRSSSARRWS